MISQGEVGHRKWMAALGGIREGKKAGRHRVLEEGNSHLRDSWKMTLEGWETASPAGNGAPAGEVAGAPASSLFI